MGQDSKIEWTDHTYNPWWGCVKVSPGCENCYAETLSHRWGNDIWGPAKTTDRKFFGLKHWQEPIKWNHAARHLPDHVGKKVFCASMCDVFEDHPGVEVERIKLWNLIQSAPNLIWQLLTKRPENIMEMIPKGWQYKLPDNIWIGTSVEDQKRADERIPHLLEVPATVHFLSCEPLLEQVDLNNYLYNRIVMGGARHMHRNITWVIVGGESGPGKRPFDTDWARVIRHQCDAAGVAFFMKQVDKVQPVPEDLLIRQFPV